MEVKRINKFACLVQMNNCFKFYRSDLTFYMDDNVSRNQKRVKTKVSLNLDMNVTSQTFLKPQTKIMISE